jgi:hypothetical protein
MKPNYYLIISDCVEKGTALGYNRAFKHDPNPNEFFIKEQINDAIMQLISEYFVFDFLL